MYLKLPQGFTQQCTTAANTTTNDNNTNNKKHSVYIVPFKQYNC